MVGPVFPVKSLSEALSIWVQFAREGKPFPTFTTTREQWPTFEADTANSYTIEQDGHTFRGVMIHVAEKPAVNPNHMPAPMLVQ